MAKIKGRPKIAGPKEKRVRFTVTAMQDFIIKHKAAKAGVTIPEFLRQVALNEHVKCKWTAEERQMVKQMIGMSNNIHQLVMQARKEEAMHTELLFTKYRGILDEIINTLCHNR